MKRLLVCVLFLPVLLLPLSAASQISASDAQELEKIVTELGQIVDEQQTIIENSQNRNEELEKLSQKQSETINELKSLSESKQKTIDEQAKTISELEASLKEPKKSWTLTSLLTSFLAALTTFLCGCIVGAIFI